MTTQQDFEALWQKAANDWAKSKAGDGSPSIDAWRTNSLFKNYTNEYGLATHAGATQYNLTSNKPSTNGLYTQTYTNGTSSRNSATFQYSDTLTNTFTVSATESLKITESASAELSLEGLVKVSSSLSIEVSISATEAYSSTESQTWSVNQTVNERPSSVTTATFTVQKSSIVGSATVPVTVYGRVAIGLNKKYNGHYFWFIPIANLLTDTNNLPSWLTANQDGSVTFHATYDLSGVVADNVVVNLSAAPLPGAAPAPAPQPPATTVPGDPADAAPPASAPAKAATGGNDPAGAPPASAPAKSATAGAKAQAPSNKDPAGAAPPASVHAKSATAGEKAQAPSH